MKVLEVVPYYEPAWAFGGPPRVMSGEARELTRRGHSVTVFTTDAYERDRRLPPGPVDVGGVDVRRFPNLSNRAAFERYRFQPRGMRHALRHVDTDIAHLSELRHELAVLTWRACRARDLPLVVSAHGTLPRRGGWKGTLRGQYDRAFVGPMVREAAALIAQTAHEGELYLGAGARPEQVQLVPLGLGTPPMPGTGGAWTVDVPDDARVVMFLGRIHPLKGVLRLIRGFAAAHREFDDVWLVVAGRDDGGGQEQAERLAAELGVGDRVVFPGPVYGDLRFEAYRRADLFAITPTHFEETSLASLEAASVGTPLLVSSQAEVPYLQEYGGGTMIGPDEDPGRALVDLLGQDLTAMGERARAMIEERHHWSQVGARLERLFSEVA